MLLAPSTKGAPLHLLFTAHKCRITGRGISLSLTVQGTVKRLERKLGSNIVELLKNYINWELLSHGSASGVEDKSTMSEKT